MRLPSCWPPVAARRKRLLRLPLKKLLLPRPRPRQLPMLLRPMRPPPAMPLRRPRLLLRISLLLLSSKH